MMNVEEYEDKLFHDKVDKELEKFNWGAFGLGLIWAPFNGTGISYYSLFGGMLFCLWGAYILPVIKFFFILTAPAIILAFSIYAGRKGNQWAWDGKKWKSVEYFSQIQKKWAAAYAIYFAIVFGFFVVWLMILVCVGGSFISQMKSDGGPEKFMNSLIVKEVLTKSPRYVNATSGEEVAKLYVENTPRTSLYKKNSVVEKSKGGEEYILTFYKDGKDCSLQKKNCYVIMNDIVGQTAEPKLKTYYDNNGKTYDVILKYRKK